MPTGRILNVASTAAQAARIGYRGLMRGKRLIIPGRRDRVLVFFERFFPRRLVTAAAGRMLAE